MKNDVLTVDAVQMEREQFDTVIIGLGKTGMSCVRYLANHGSSSFAVVDSRLEPPELNSLYSDFPEVPVFLGSYHEEILAAAGQLIVSPGVSLKEDAIKNACSSGVGIVNDIEIFCRQISTPVVAITGSNGKSTVATLICDMINRTGRHALLGGNIGIPALDLLDSSPPDYYVLELSSFQLEPLTSLNACASVVLNICEDHMDRYRDIDEYSAVKARIYAGNGRMVINLDDAYVAGYDRHGYDTIFYSLDEPAGEVFGVREVDGTRYLARGNSNLLPVSSLKLHGDHNISNCLAALALGSAIQLPMQPMLDTLQEFPGLPHRCQWVAGIRGVQWYNDSKGTNVGASCAAIKGLRATGPVILIAGGIGKDADFSPLAETARHGLCAAVLIGRDAGIIGEAFHGCVPVYYATSMEAAVDTADRIARKGDVVLLSPACASFDMFTDYQDRGTVFMDCVARLEQGDRS
jgi:UDP-N-acetylmuramoylalanine--D-glutamate ligase